MDLFVLVIEASPLCMCDAVHASDDERHAPDGFRARCFSPLELTRIVRAVQLRRVESVEDLLSASLDDGVHVAVDVLEEDDRTRLGKVLAAKMEWWELVVWTWSWRDWRHGCRWLDMSPGLLQS